MATICSQVTDTNILGFPGSKSSDYLETFDSSTAFDDDSVHSIDLIKDVDDRDGYRKLTKSLFVEQILDVSFSKDGNRFYRVQWESTWESERDLSNACKGLLHTYWDNHIQFDIILDKAVYPEEASKDRNVTTSDNTTEDSSIPTLEETNNTVTPSFYSENHALTPAESIEYIEPVVPSSDVNEKTSSEEELRRKDIPEQYKNVGFAKSVRESFGKELPSENEFDFVEHYLAEKLVSKSRNGIRKKVRVENIRELISYKNGTRVTCDICSESFADTKSLKNHKVCRHDLYSPHQCSVCMKMFMKPGDVRRHMASHSPTRAHYCYFCEKTYKTKNHLHRHIKLKHPDLNVADNDILKEMLSTNDADPSELNHTVINITENDANDMLSTETLNNSFNPSNSTLSSFSPLAANNVLFQDTLRSGNVVLQQPDLSETFLNTTAETMQMCLIDKTENFFNCTPFTPVNTLLQT